MPEHADYLMKVGVDCARQRRFEEAVESYCEALDIYGEFGNTLGRANALNSIGMALDGQGRVDEALEKYEEAL